jgi:Cell wall-active antibiotics response 4TMS YvqF
VGMAQSPEERHVTLFGGLTRRGPWTMAQRTRVVTLAGTTELDLTEAQVPPDAVLTHIALFGGVRLVVPADIHVAIRSVSFVGNAGLGIADDEGTQVITVRRYGVFGSVHVVRS